MRNKKFEEIEDLLSALLSVLSEREYEKLIQENGALKKYDFILAKIENEDFSDVKKNIITNQELDEIISYLKKTAN